MQMIIVLVWFHAKHSPLKQSIAFGLAWIKVLNHFEKKSDVVQNNNSGQNVPSFTFCVGTLKNTSLCILHI